MADNEDLVKQPNEIRPNLPFWSKKLTIIVICVLFVTIFGAGGYILGARQLVTIPTVATRQIVVHEKFDLQRILYLVSYFDAKSTKKFLIHYTIDKDPQGGYTSIYLVDTTLDLQSAIKIIDVDFTGISSFISYGAEKKYIAIELTGTDIQNLAIADEDGKLITKNLLETNNFKFKDQELTSYLVSFERWENEKTFWGKASPYGSPNDPDRPMLELLIDAETGKILESN